MVSFSPSSYYYKARASGNATPEQDARIWHHPVFVMNIGGYIFYPRKWWQIKINLFTGYIGKKDLISDPSIPSTTSYVHSGSKRFPMWVYIRFGV